MTTLIQNNPGCAPSPLGGAVVTGSYSGQLKDPFNTSVPDFRPVGNGIAGTTATPPNNGFFVTSATYFGAVAPVGVSLGGLPWYAGWTEPWQGPATP